MHARLFHLVYIIYVYTCGCILTYSIQQGVAISSARIWGSTFRLAYLQSHSSKRHVCNQTYVRERDVSGRYRIEDVEWVKKGSFFCSVSRNAENEKDNFSFNDSDKLIHSAILSEDDDILSNKTLCSNQRETKDSYLTQLNFFKKWLNGGSEYFINNHNIRQINIGQINTTLASDDISGLRLYFEKTIELMKCNNNLETLVQFHKQICNNKYDYENILVYTGIDNVLQSLIYIIGNINKMLNKTNDDRYEGVVNNDNENETDSGVGCISNETCEGLTHTEKYVDHEFLSEIYIYIYDLIKSIHKTINQKFLLSVIGRVRKMIPFPVKAESMDIIKHFRQLNELIGDYLSRSGDTNTSIEYMDKLNSIIVNYKDDDFEYKPLFRNSASNGTAESERDGDGLGYNTTYDNTMSIENGYDSRQGGGYDKLSKHIEASSNRTQAAWAYIQNRDVEYKSLFDLQRSLCVLVRHNCSSLLLMDALRKGVREGIEKKWFINQHDDGPRRWGGEVEGIYGYVYMYY